MNDLRGYVWIGIIYPESVSMGGTFGARQIQNRICMCTPKEISPLNHHLIHPNTKLSRNAMRVVWWASNDRQDA